VLRGGSFNNNRQNARCANRNANHPVNLNDNIGFRLAASHASPRCGHQGPALTLLPEMLIVHGCAAEAQ
jgi:hypothetical protein